MVFKKIRKAFSGSFEDGSESDYLELDLEQENQLEKKVNVRIFTLKDYDDVTEILNSLREGYTIAVIDIKELRKKDSIELKRAVSKIKKTIDALEGSIAGCGENIVIATPSFAKIEKKASSSENSRQEKKNKFE
ncbi:MAG: cell division protein SepF [Nanoarchaeota archaeon]